MGVILGCQGDRRRERRRGRVGEVSRDQNISEERDLIRAIVNFRFGEGHKHLHMHHSRPECGPDNVGPRAERVNESTSDLFHPKQFSSLCSSDRTARNARGKTAKRITRLLLVPGWELGQKLYLGGGSETDSNIRDWRTWIAQRTWDHYN